MPDDLEHLPARLDRRTFLARLGAVATAGAVAAFISAWADCWLLLARFRGPPRPLGVITINDIGPIAFYEDGIGSIAELHIGAVRDLLGSLARLSEWERAHGDPAVFVSEWRQVQIVLHDWVTYTCSARVATPRMFHPLALPALVPFAGAPPPRRLAAAIRAFRRGPDATRRTQPGGLELARVWMYGPEHVGRPGMLTHPESTASAFARVYGEGPPWGPS